jgi:hypothetical protein
VPLREFFHLMTIVDDFDQAEARFDALFSPVTFMPKHWSDLDKRWASLARVGPDFVLEIMEPSTDPADSDAPLVKFRERFGPGLHSLSWLVDEAAQAAVVRRLLDGGVRVVGPDGSLLGADDAGRLPRVVFTHPKDTYGQIELMNTVPDGPRNDPYFQAGWSNRWFDEHPLGLRRTSHLTNLVDDIERATVVFGDLLEGDVFHKVADRDAKRAYVLVGNQTVVELLQPLSDRAFVAGDLRRSAHLPYAVTFAVRDLARAERHVQEAGFSVVSQEKDTFTLEPADCMGAIIAFTTRTIPNDPRGCRSVS